MSLTPLPPPPPPRKVCVWHIFGLTSNEWSLLAAELKFRENAASVVYKTLLKEVEVSVRVSL